MKLDENLSYKFVALGVALILWMSMLGRRDSTLVRDFSMQVILGPNMELANPAPEYIKVEIAGARVALKKINQINPFFTVDLSNARPGKQKIQLSKEGLTLPIGTHVVSMEPSEITVDLRVVAEEPGEKK